MAIVCLTSLVICLYCPSDHTVACGVVVVVIGIVVIVVVVVVGVCNRSQMITSKCTCVIFGVSIGLGPS